MRRFRLFVTVAALFLALGASAQSGEDTVDYDIYMAELAAKCPIDLGDDWVLKSFTTIMDMAFIEIETPAVLTGFFPMLTEDNDSVKAMWLRQLSQYDERWKRFVKFLVATDRSLSLTVSPRGSGLSATFVYDQSHFVK